MKKVLVVGGTGFIGFHIIKEAKKRKFKVHSISLHSPKIYRHHKGVKYIQADISNFESLKKKLKDSSFDYVINAGGYGEHPDFGYRGIKLVEAHLYGLINLLHILKKKKN